MTRAPEKLLSVAELVALTGMHRTTVTKMMKDTKEWCVKGGAKQIGADYFLTASFYNRWLDGKDIALPTAKS